jgi:hypothetical protein
MAGLTLSRGDKEGAITIMPIRGLFYPNAELTWEIAGAQVGVDEITCQPIYEEGVTESASLWLEMNVPITPLNAEPWDEDFSSEWLRLNLSGRFLTPQGRPTTWPRTLIAQKKCSLNYAINSTQRMVVDAYPFPVATDGLRLTQRALGDGIRVQARVKAKYLLQDSYTKAGQ